MTGRPEARAGPVRAPPPGLSHPTVPGRPSHHPSGPDSHGASPTSSSAAFRHLLARGRHHHHRLFGSLHGQTPRPTLLPPQRGHLDILSLNECADFSGNQVGRSPRHSLNGSLEARRSLTPAGLSGFVQISSSYRSRRFTDESNLVWLPAYSVTDLRVGMESGRWTAAAFVRNAFDSSRIQTAQRNIDLGRPDGFAPGRGFNAYLPSPRAFGVRLEARTW